MDITATNKSSTTTDRGTVGTMGMEPGEGTEATEDMALLKVVAGEVSSVTTCQLYHCLVSPTPSLVEH